MIAYKNAKCDNIYDCRDDRPLAPNATCDTQLDIHLYPVSIIYVELARGVALD